MTNEMHNSYDQFLFHSFLSVLHVSNESSRSSSGARHNILYYTVQSVQACRRLACTTVRCNTSILCRAPDERLDSFETCRTENCGIKIDYKNCASRCSLTHCNMMHGTLNVKLFRYTFFLWTVHPLLHRATVVVLPYMFLHNITLQQYSASGVGILLILEGRARPSALSHVSCLRGIDW